MTVTSHQVWETRAMRTRVPRSRHRGAIVDLAARLWMGTACGLMTAQAEPLVSPWGETVASRPEAEARILPEYPRPQLVRDAWLNLNGQWDYAFSGDPLHPPPEFEGTIRVPFAVESYLSGVGRRLDAETTLWYRRVFHVPPAWQGQRVHLHFGAVDWDATVFVNRHRVGTHQGGYHAFSMDLTPYLNGSNENELVVAVRDPTEGDQPRGKQSKRPEGIFYLPNSGIWQTVWLEPVPELHIQRILVTPEWGAGRFTVQVMAADLDRPARVEVAAYLDGTLAGKVAGVPGVPLSLPLQPARAWSPQEPILYDLTVSLQQEGRMVDTVCSYAGLREIRLGADAQGHRVLLLNGQPLFQVGVLDQGYWPDGLYTAPSDEALRYDLETAKQLGFNLVRKHVKVEPQRWYYWADRLGLLVWQDMPSGDNASDQGRRRFEIELKRMLQQLSNHPCIVMWVLFNEGWGQFDTDRLVRAIKQADPGRLVNNASGWTDAKVGDVIDLHSYPDPQAPAPETSRASVLGEFGGLGLVVDGHAWSDQTWAYQGVTDSPSLTRHYGKLLDRVHQLRRTHGLAAAVYTQLTDVETECNGFLTYDRRVLKVDPVAIRYANRGWPASASPAMWMPTARELPEAWRYTRGAPGPDWNLPGFDASSWLVGTSGFGNPATPGAIVNTPWSSPDIWLRRMVNLPAEPAPDLRLVVHADEEAEIYFNGVLALTLREFTLGYRVFPILPDAFAALRPGPNLVAVHCLNRTGGQFIDVGLIPE